MCCDDYAIQWARRVFNLRSKKNANSCNGLPLVLGMGLVEVEAVAEHDPGRDCDLGPARITANKQKSSFGQDPAECKMRLWVP